MIEFELIDDSQTVEVDLIDDSETIEVGLIKEIDSYNELKDQPSINNVTLEGNKTLDELNIQQKGDYATNTYVNTQLDTKVDKVSGKGLSTNDFTNEYKNNVDSNTSARHTHSNKTVLDNISSTDISNWNNKSTFSGDYNDLTNKPTIPNKTSQLTNDSGFINSSYHDDTKQDKEDNSLTTTNKTIPNAINEVNSIAKGANQALSYSNYSAMVTAFNGFASDKYSVGQNVMIVTVEVPDLWISGVEETSSIYTYVDDATIVSALQTNGYIQVGYYKLSMLETQKVDLTNYVTKTDYATSSVGGVIKTSSTSGTQMSVNGTILGVTKTNSQYNDSSEYLIINKGTLENVITGKGLVSNTDYATSDTGGVIKTSASVGTAKSSAGNLISVEKTYADYTDAGNYMFVSKGTLENVITGKKLATKNDIPKVFYGTCSTSAGTAAKVIVCDAFTSSDLVVGTRITVLFTNANSYNGQATLNINGTGAKNIYYNGTTTSARYMWVAGESVDFIYNGTQWATINGGLATTTYYGVTKLYTGASSDSQALALTPRSLYYLANYSIAPYYSSSSTYAVGDIVRYSYYIYRCTTAIETAESWDETHWQQLDPLQKQIDNISTTISNIVTLSQADYDALVNGGTVDANTYYFIT